MKNDIEKESTKLLKVKFKFESGGEKELSL